MADDTNATYSIKLQDLSGMMHMVAYVDDKAMGIAPTPLKGANPSGNARDRRRVRRAYRKRIWRAANRNAKT